MCETQMGPCLEFDRGLAVGRDHGGANILPTARVRLKTGERGVSGGAMLS